VAVDPDDEARRSGEVETVTVPQVRSTMRLASDTGCPCLHGAPPGQELRQAHDVLGGGCEREGGIDPLGSSEAGLRRGRLPPIQPNASSMRLAALAQRVA